MNKKRQIKLKILLRKLAKRLYKRKENKMAVLNREDFDELVNNLSNKLQEKLEAIDFHRGHLEAAYQAVEDLIENSRTAISNAIDTATTPYVFSNQNKKRIVAYYFLRKFAKDID